MSIQCNKCIFDSPPPQTPTSCTANTVFDIISRSPRSRCIIAYSDDLHKSDAHKQHVQTQNTRQFRRGWWSNFSPLTWCNTGPYSGKRRAARGAPQMLHTQEEEERQKCIIKEKKNKHLNEDCNVRLCTTVIRSVSAACLKSSALFLSPFYITIAGPLYCGWNWGGGRGGGTKTLPSIGCKLKIKTTTTIKTIAPGDVKKWVQAEGNGTESVHENWTEKLESGVLVYVGKMDKGGKINL